MHRVLAFRLPQPDIHCARSLGVHRRTGGREEGFFGLIFGRVHESLLCFRLTSLLGPSVGESLGIYVALYLGVMGSCKYEMGMGSAKYIQS